VTLTIGPDDKLWASAPEPLKGLLEIRGIGIVKVTASEPVVTGLLVTLIPAEEIERLPSDEISQTDFFGVAVPSIMIDPAVRSAPARIRAAVLALEDGKLKTVKNLQI